MALLTRRIKLQKSTKAIKELVKLTQNINSKLNLVEQNLFFRVTQSLPVS